MAQRKTNERELYFGEEGASEGVDPYAGSQPPGANAIKVTNLMASPDVAFYARTFLGQSGNAAGKIAAQTDPRLSFTVECRGGGSVITPKIDPLLKVVLGRDIGADPQNYKQADDGAATVQSGSNSSSINVTGYTGTFSKGNAVAIETGNGTNLYEVGWIQDFASNVITLTKPLLMGTPAIGQARVKPSVTYRPMNGGHQSLTFRVYLEPTTPTNRITFVGCKGSMKFDTPALGAIPTITFNWKAIGWRHETGGSRPSPSYDGTTPPTAYKFRVDGTDSATKISNWDLGQIVARKRSQTSTFGTFAELVTGRSLRGAFDAYDVDESQFASWTAGTEHEITHQFGQAQYNIVAYQIAKAQRTDVEYSDDNNLTTDWVRFQGNISSGEDEIRLAFL